MRGPAMCRCARRWSLVCFYIGYFGAGAGFLIMAVLAIFGIQSIREVNALKVVATTIANGIAVVTFIVERQIVWHLCLLMMLTAALGGYLGGALLAPVECPRHARLRSGNRPGHGCVLLPAHPVTMRGMLRAYPERK